MAGAWLGDTWGYNGVDWGQIVPLNGPGLRSQYGMVFDSSRKRTVVFCGGLDCHQRGQLALERCVRLADDGAGGGGTAVRLGDSVAGLASLQSRLLAGLLFGSW